MKQMCVFVCMLLWVASAKGQPTYCSGAVKGGSVYFSDVFEVPPESGRESDVRQDYRFGFARFVVGKYGLEPGRDGLGYWEGGQLRVCKENTCGMPERQRSKREKPWWRVQDYRNWMETKKPPATKPRPLT